jgi:fluoride ion exporter CrcB/FEX
MLERLGLIFLAGGFSALARYGVQGSVNDVVTARPTLLGTLLVNLSGALALGLPMAFTEDRLCQTFHDYRSRQALCIEIELLR